MTAQTFSISANGKLKFFLAYAVSVVLFVFIALSIFRQGESENKAVEVTSDRKPEENNLLNEESQGLQDKLEALGKTYLANSNMATNEKPAAVQTAENDVQKALDEWREKASHETNKPVQEKAVNLISFYQSELTHQSQLYNRILQTRKDDQALVVKSNDEEMQQLRNLIAEKEKQIASLQTSVREKPVVAASSNSDEARQWKQKAADLKAANDKLSKQINTMTASYRIIVEDNQRLLTRLQEKKKQ